MSPIGKAGVSRIEVISQPVRLIPAFSRGLYIKCTKLARNIV